MPNLFEFNENLKNRIEMADRLLKEFKIMNPDEHRAFQLFQSSLNYADGLLSKKELEVAGENTLFLLIKMEKELQSGVHDNNPQKLSEIGLSLAIGAFIIAVAGEVNDAVERVKQ